MSKFTTLSMSLDLDVPYFLNCALVWFDLCVQSIHNKVISGFLALRQARAPVWLGSNPRQRGPCRSQGGITIRLATNAPLAVWKRPKRVSSACPGDQAT
ncbi:hypothetical protein PoB_006359100 [Plakobranchus ocellatus]|uniref:Uncharacterized protein n=1 Tax=Plakobranchus ocellatus TaxID=259542 RepID=A0AAV4CZ42_9GAST|nr:hypothetical protein PoB_006359100 [Plakobranchus ocellatus]